MRKCSIWFILLVSFFQGFCLSSDAEQTHEGEVQEACLKDDESCVQQEAKETHDEETTAESPSKIVQIKPAFGTIACVALVVYAFFVLKKAHIPIIPFPWGLRNRVSKKGEREAKRAEGVREEQGNRDGFLVCGREVVDEEIVPTFLTNLCQNVSQQRDGSCAIIDSRLQDSVDQQIELAKKMKLEFEVVPYENIERCLAERDDLRFAPLIERRLTYAQQIGMVKDVAVPSNSGL